MTRDEGQSSRDWGVIGHRRAVETLTTAVSRGAVSHAYLVSGPARVGKATLARRFSQALLCERPVSERPCGVCSACRRVEHGQHPDVDVWSVARQVADGGKDARQTGLSIETARRIGASVWLRPFEGRWKVVVVEDAETLTVPAQQALLKTLEEPTGFTVFLLLASDADAMLETVRSRCLDLPLQLVPTADITSGLTERGVEHAANLARLARGRPGWAVAAAGDPQLAQDERERMVGAESWVKASPLDRQILAYQTGDRFAKARAAVIEEVQAAEVVWRDLLLSAVGSEAFASDPDRGGRLGISAELPQLHAALTATRLGISDLRANVRPRLALQAMVSSWPNLSS